MDMIQDATRIAEHAQQPTQNPQQPQQPQQRKSPAQLPPGREYLSFRLGAEEYGIDILKVQEIRSYEAPTRIANAPAFLRGVINLRGVIVPIVDLRVKFGCEAVIDAVTAVIVLGVKGRVVGAVVDSVSDVLELPAETIKPAPQMGSVVDTSYLIGIASVAERMLVLVDIESLMSSAELGLIDEAAAR